MTAPFDWAGLWAEACEAYDTADAKRAICAERDEAAAAYIRERIEAAFVPVGQWEDLKRIHAENCEAYDRACVEREWLRERAGPYTGHCITCAEATARAEDAEARAEVLEELISELSDDLEAEVQDRWGYDDRLSHKLKRDMDVVVRARQALGGERE